MEQFFDNAPVVFTGSLIDAQHDINTITDEHGREIAIGLGVIYANFRVGRGYKGVEDGQVVKVRTVDQSSACGFTQLLQESPGAIYLFFTGWREEGGDRVLPVGICSGAALYDLVVPDLEELVNRP